MPYQTMFDNFFSSQRPIFSLSRRVWNPPTDIYETNAGTIIKMEVAGLEDSQLQITADRNLLLVRGQRADSHASENIGYHLMEVHYGQFERVFAFSYILDEDAIKASYDKGFLIIEVARQPSQTANVTVQVLNESMEQ